MVLEDKPTYTRSSKTRYRTKEQNRQAIVDQLAYKDILIEAMRESPTEHVGTLLLDSSLISESKNKNYDIKIIQCGDYYQVYQLKNKKIILDKNLESDIKKVDTEYLHKKENEKIQDKIIEFKNITRSKINLQRLVKSNEDIFKTFITLTFEENITDIEEANKKFHIWRRNIKRLKNDFKYVCVPEFQKRGAVHYHLLTNIDYNDFSLLSQEERKIYNKKSGWQVGRDIKGWSYGHNMAKNLKDINVVGYITKYMTKDIDNRLWGKRRYLYSQNLNHPTIVYLDTDYLCDFVKYIDILGYDIKFKKSYMTRFEEEIEFTEYKRSDI